MWVLICVLENCPADKAEQEAMGSSYACMGCGAIYDRPVA